MTYRIKLLTVGLIVAAIGCSAGNATAFPRPRRVRVSRRGLMKLKVSCPRGEQVCRVDLRLRRKGTTVARKKFRVAGGETRRVSLRLTGKARRRLLRSGSLRVTAVAAARYLAANRATTRTRLRLLAPG